jgi:hypothetical protein
MMYLLLRILELNCIGEFQLTSLWEILFMSMTHTSCKFETFVDMYLAHKGPRIK